MSLFPGPNMLVEENNNAVGEASREHSASGACRKGELRHSMSALSVTSAVDLGIHQQEHDNRPFQDRSDASLYLGIRAHSCALSCSLKMGKCCIFGEYAGKCCNRPQLGKAGLDPVSKLS